MGYITFSRLKEMLRQNSDHYKIYILLNVRGMCFFRKPPFLHSNKTRSLITKIKKKNTKTLLASFFEIVRGLHHKLILIVLRYFPFIQLVVPTYMGPMVYPIIYVSSTPSFYFFIFDLFYFPIAGKKILL